MGSYWICDACHSLNDPRYSACYKCRVKRGAAKPQPIIPGATVGHAASTYYGAPVGDTRGEPSAMLALLIGGAMTVLVTAGWYWFEASIHYGRGRVAWAVGLLIAATVLIAGTLGGRRRVALILPIISFLLTLVAVTVGEYLIISAGLVPPDEIVTGIPVASPDQVIAAIADFMGSDPLRPILWVVALAAGWLVPWGALVGSAKPER